MPEHPFGWLCLLPPLVAILAAMVTRKVVFSLLLGVFCGSAITHHASPIPTAVDALETQLWRTLTDPGRMRMFAFTLLMGAMVGVINRCGGMRGLVALVTPAARTRRRGQLLTWLLGLVVFFDDYANTLLLGNTLRPVCDRLRISREKLAYLVDSTAAPVAGLAVISTWVAIEMDSIAEGLRNLEQSLDVEAFSLFLTSIPYRFYMWTSLACVVLVGLLGRDFGPMLRAERRTMAEPPRQDAENTQEACIAPWYYALLPIGVTLALVVTLVYATGSRDLDESQALTWTRIAEIAGEGDSSLALQYGALAGLLTAAIMCRLGGRLRGDQILAAAGVGARTVLPALAILWTASTLSRMTGNQSADGRPTSTPFEHQDHRLYTGAYLQSLLMGEQDNWDDDTGKAQGEVRGKEERAAAARKKLWPLPTVVFALAAVIAFCTGTSWGTMGILLPMAIPLCVSLITVAGESEIASHPILLGCVGSVLAGAVFGDHCSPISDTTVLSSQASGCDHLAHVQTQLPYALLVAIICVLLGTLPIGWGVSLIWLIPLQLAATAAAFLILGRRV